MYIPNDFKVTGVSVTYGIREHRRHLLLNKMEGWFPHIYRYS